jgi:glutamine amidotransferase-like uncharacterized protein
MSGRAGFVWGERQHFNRYIEECGVTCELVTPQMLATPFFRPVLSCLIIPTGFANPAYSNILPALRASSSRIRRFVESGGNLLVFGAALDRPDAYDWLPFPVRYSHEYTPRAVTCAPPSPTGRIVEDYDTSCIECDGTFSDHDAECIGTAGSAAVLLERTIGSGTIVITSIHEYPSRAFLKEFCSCREPVQF